MPKMTGYEVYASIKTTFPADRRHPDDGLRLRSDAFHCTGEAGGARSRPLQTVPRGDAQEIAAPGVREEGAQMTGRITCLFLAAALAASCAQTASSKAPAPSDEMAVLVSHLDVKGDLDKLPDGERVGLESAAIKIIAKGTDAVPAILADMKARREATRRLVLARLLLMTLDRAKPGAKERTKCDAWIASASEEMLKSAEASDRYTGTVLSALLIKPRLEDAALRLLDDPDAANREFGGQILQDVSGVAMGYDANAPIAERKPAVERWKQWWKTNHERAYYYLPEANPITSAFRAESTRVERQAGPYALEVTDADGGPAAGAVVMYSYFFTTFDGRGEKLEERSTTDADGKMLLAGQEVVARDDVRGRRGSRREGRLRATGRPHSAAYADEEQLLYCGDARAAGEIAVRGRRIGA